MAKFLLIDKPKNWTSHDVVAYIRNLAKKQTNNKKIKVGHSGTLDPFATGLLIVGIGREATKRLDEFKNMPKTYIATIRLGAVSDTYDSTGKIMKHEAWNPDAVDTGSRFKHRDMKHFIDIDTVKKIVMSFLGKQTQIPPMYSAKKVKGKKLYELARQGIEVKREPNKIEIYNIKLLKFNYPYLEIEIKCSAGTYIRTLAHDIGQALGTGAYCDELERTKIGNYSVKDAKTPKTDLKI